MGRADCADPPSKLVLGVGHICGISLRPCSCSLLGLGDSILTDGQDNSAPQSAIPGVIAAGAQVETVRGGFKGLEGPVAAPDGGLYFSDIPTNRTYKLAPDGTISVWREGTNGANGLFLLKDGRLLAAESTGPRIVAVAPDGQVMPLATAFSGRPFRAPNDLIPDSQGRGLFH